MKTSILRFFLLGLMLVWSSCGKNSEEEVLSGIESAISDLTSGSCQRAIDTLSEIGYQPSNIRYLKTYASAYSCRAGYSTSRFFVDDLPLVGSPSELGGFARFSTSDTMNQPKEGSYRDMQKAIDALLYAGDIPRDTEPYISERKRLLDNEQLKDLHAQLLYLNLVQLGKFLYYYGSSSSSGVKGSGGAGRNCIVSYDETIEYDGVSIGDILTATAGTCGVGDTGHPDIGSDPSNLSTGIMCEGLVLLNNTLELIPEIIANTAGDDLDSVDSYVQALKNLIDILDPDTQRGAAAGILSYSNCVATFDDGADEPLQYFYASIFEVLFE